MEFNGVFVIKDVIKNLIVAFIPERDLVAFSQTCLVARWCVKTSESRLERIEYKLRKRYLGISNMGLYTSWEILLGMTLACTCQQYIWKMQEIFLGEVYAKLHADGHQPHFPKHNENVDHTLHVEDCALGMRYTYIMPKAILQRQGLRPLIGKTKDAAYFAMCGYCQRNVKLDMLPHFIRVDTLNYFHMDGDLNIWAFIRRIYANLS